MDGEQIRKQARDENTPPEILAELAKSKDKEIRRYIAGNPNTPNQALLNLGAEFPKELLDNSIFDLLLLENPNLILNTPVNTIRSLVLEEGISNYLIELIASRLNESRSISEVLCWNPNTSGKIIDSIFESAHRQSCILYITLHPNISKATILKLLKYGEENPGIYRLMAENICIPDFYIYSINYWNYIDVRIEFRNKITNKKEKHFSCLKNSNTSLSYLDWLSINSSDSFSRSAVRKKLKRCILERFEKYYYIKSNDYRLSIPF